MLLLTYTEVLSRQFFKGFSRHRFKRKLYFDIQLFLTLVSVQHPLDRKVKSSYSKLQKPPKHLIFGYENSHLEEKKIKATTKKSQSHVGILCRLEPI